MVSKISLNACGALLAAALCALPAVAEEPLATVNGDPVTARDVSIAEDDVGPALGQVPEEQRRDYLVSYLTDLKLLAQKATKEGLADSQEFKDRLAYLREKALMEVLLKREAGKAVTDEAAKSFYDQQVGKAPREPEVHARHILVESEDEAKKVEDQLRKGGDFGEIAKKETKDPSGTASGGDLGWFTKDQMVPEFAEAAFKLKPGEISDPVKTGFGWHVIKVEERREKAPPSYDEVKDRIRAYLERRAQAEMVSKLRAEAKIERKTAPAGEAAKSPAPAGGTATPAPAQSGAQPAK